MKFKGTLSLLGLLIILVGWVYWSDIRGREERERAADEAGRAIPDDSDTRKKDQAGKSITAYSNKGRNYQVG